MDEEKNKQLSGKENNYEHKDVKVANEEKLAMKKKVSENLPAVKCLNSCWPGL